MEEIPPQKQNIMPQRNKHYGYTIPQKSLTEFENCSEGRETVAGVGGKIDEITRVRRVSWASIK
jgi:hypothetical protein